MDFLDRVDPTLRDGLAMYEMLGLAEHQRLDGRSFRRSARRVRGRRCPLGHDPTRRTGVAPGST